MFSDPKLQFFYEELKREGFTHHRAVLYCTMMVIVPYERLRARWRKNELQPYP